MTTENETSGGLPAADNLDPNDITFLEQTFSLPKKVIGEILSRVGASSRWNVISHLRNLTHPVRA